jgi:hypothetical protein
MLNLIVNQALLNSIPNVRVPASTRPALTIDDIGDRGAAELPESDILSVAEPR